MLGKPHPEQDRIGERLRAARPKLPGRLLEVPGNRNPRGMIIVPCSGDRRGKQDSAYGLLRHDFFISPSVFFPAGARMKTAVILPAGGRGLRMGGSIPKQFLELCGRPLLLRTIDAFVHCASVDLICPVVPPDMVEAVETLLQSSGCGGKIAAAVAGGSHRQESVSNGLRTLGADFDVILVHDAVRPFVSQSLILACIDAAIRHGAALAALQAQDTIKQDDGNGSVARTLPRETVYLAQTPQAFRREVLVEAFEKACADDFVGTDESLLVERTGRKVHIVPGERTNVKITTPEDMAWAEFYVRSGS